MFPGFGGPIDGGAGGITASSGADSRTGPITFGTLVVGSGRDAPDYRTATAQAAALGAPGAIHPLILLAAGLAVGVIAMRTFK